MATAEQIRAARRYAPPLVTSGRVDRRGAILRSVSRRAIEYAAAAGMSVEDVYPGEIAAARALTPRAGSAESVEFLRVTGLREAEVYPPVVAIGWDLLPSRRRWRWGWIAVGVIVGAALAGPVGALAGGLIGGVR
jgi:hypothetical protein